MVDFNFSEQDIAFREEVRAFLDSDLKPHIRAGANASPGVFVEPDIGMEWHQALYKKGWVASQWPVEYGGPGWSPMQNYIFEKECAIAGAPSLPVLSLKLLGPIVYTFGTDEQKHALLPRILSGEDYWCQGFSEPNSGSDLASLQTFAKREGDKYIVNGSKIWTTHAHHANRIFCLVRTEKSERPQQGISFILLDLDQPGIEIKPIITLAGDHEVNQVFFDNAEARAEDLIGAEGQGWEIAKFLLENERGGSCHAPKLLSDLTMLENEAMTESFGDGQVLGETPDWKRKLARLRLKAEALEVIELQIVSELTQGRPPGPQTSLTKYITSKLRQDVDELAVDLYGHAGLQLEATRPLYGGNAPQAIFSDGAQIASARYLNSRAWTIFGGTNEVQANIISKTVLGL
jgi:alkylation response protein AidB-like acyl-CoA dehydrogenase